MNLKSIVVRGMEGQVARTVSKVKRGSELEGARIDRAFSRHCGGDRACTSYNRAIPYAFDSLEGPERAKRAAGRLKDLLDLEEIAEIKRPVSSRGSGYFDS